MAMYDPTAQLLLAVMGIGFTCIGLIDNIGKLITDFTSEKTSRVIMNVTTTLQYFAGAVVMVAAVMSYFLVKQNYPFITTGPF